MKAKSSPTRDYTTGRTASELHVSPSHVRALCQAGIIAGRVTQGGHWRIPKGEIDRLRREGVPDPPPATPAEPQNETASPPTAGQPTYRHPSLLADPSGDAIAAADEVVRLENEVKAIGLKRAKEEGLDWFRERGRSQAEARAEHERQRLELRARKIRREWENTWVEYALQQIPQDGPESLGLSVSECVRETLASMSPNDPPEITESLVHAAVDKELEPWRRSKEVERAIQEARTQLPYWAKSYPGPSEWELRATEAASDAIAQLRTDATTDEIRTAAIAAGKRVASEYQHTEGCRRIIESVYLFPTPKEREEARLAVRTALDKLPVGTSWAQLEQARDAALAPFKATAEAARIEGEAASRADLYLSHVDSYLQKIMADLDYINRCELAKRLRAEIRPVLMQGIIEEPMSTSEAYTFIESLIDNRLAP